MQSVSSISYAVSISYDYNHYTTGTSWLDAIWIILMGCIYFETLCVCVCVCARAYDMFGESIDYFLKAPLLTKKLQQTKIQQKTHNASKAKQGRYKTLAVLKVHKSNQMVLQNVLSNMNAAVFGL